MLLKLKKKLLIYIYYEGKWYAIGISSSKFMKENDMILTYQAQNLWRKMIWHQHIKLKIYERKWYNTNISNSKSRFLKYIVKFKHLNKGANKC